MLSRVKKLFSVVDTSDLSNVLTLTLSINFPRVNLSLPFFSPILPTITCFKKRKKVEKKRVVLIITQRLKDKSPLFRTIFSLRKRNLY